MKKNITWIVGALGLVFILIAAAGVYKFNFTNDDIYVEQNDGSVVPYDEAQKSDTESQDSEEQSTENN